MVLSLSLKPSTFHVIALYPNTFTFCGTATHKKLEKKGRTRAAVCRRVHVVSFAVLEKKCCTLLIRRALLGKHLLNF